MSLFLAGKLTFTLYNQLAYLEKFVLVKDWTLKTFIEEAQRREPAWAELHCKWFSYRNLIGLIPVVKRFTGPAYEDYDAFDRPLQLIRQIIQHGGDFVKMEKVYWDPLRLPHKAACVEFPEDYKEGETSKRGKAVQAAFGGHQVKVLKEVLAACLREQANQPHPPTALVNRRVRAVALLVNALPLCVQNLEHYGIVAFLAAFFRHLFYVARKALNQQRR